MDIYIKNYKGFTNLLYVVNDEFVIKICFDKEMKKIL